MTTEYPVLGGYGIPGPQGPRGLPGNGSLVWRGEWDSATPYPINSTVRHNGSAYTTTVAITAGQTPPPAAPWELVVAKGDVGPTGATGAVGMIFQGTWSGATAYVANDVVYHPATGSSYIAAASVTGTAPPNSPWALIAQKGATGNTGAGGPTGPQGPAGTNGTFINSWRGEWVSTAWEPGSIVEYQGSSYLATDSTTNESGPIAPPNEPWALIVKGFPVASDAAPMSWVGVWSGSRTYHRGEVVSHSGKWWVVNVSATTATPGTGSDWVASA